MSSSYTTAVVAGSHEVPVAGREAGRAGLTVLLGVAALSSEKQLVDGHAAPRSLRHERLRLIVRVVAEDQVDRRAGGSTRSRAG